MIVGVGVDLVHDGQVPDQVLREGDPFFERTFTACERELGARRADPASFFRSRFAGKEAVFKSLAACADDLKRWDAIEILADKNGAPVVQLHGSMAAHAAARGIDSVKVSLSSDEGCHLAFCIASNEGSQERT